MSDVQKQTAPACRAVDEGLCIEGREEKKDGDDGGNAEGTEGFIQDQVILAPEIMKKILEHLDLMALKRVRLVCKSWLLQAQSHIEKVAIVWLGSQSYFWSLTRFPRFIQLRTNKVPALPQPFQSLDVDLKEWQEAVPPEQALTQLFTLCPPLVITRFTADFLCLPFTRSLPFIIQCSSSLEYLKLVGRNVEKKRYRSLEQTHKSVKFPKLRHLDVSNLCAKTPDNFPCFLRWITRASPNLDKFAVSLRGTRDTCKKLSFPVLLAVDLENLTTLKLQGFVMGHGILKHFSTIRVPKLQHLSLYEISGEAAGEALGAILKKAALSLRKLELRDWKFQAESEFPVCPNVQELRLKMFPGWGDFISSRFPSLQDFRPEMPDITERPFYFGVSPRSYEGLFPATPAFDNVKTLSLRSLEYNGGGIRPMELFSTFPALESLQIRQTYLFEHYRMKTSGDPKLLDLLGGLKHLVLRGEWDKADDVRWYSFLTQLRELETLTITTSRRDKFFLIPFQDMPSLRVLRFQCMFDSNEELRQLLEITRGLEKVVIMNCCSHMRWPPDSNIKSKDLLRTFFDSAPNAVCGCKESRYFFDKK